MKKLDQIGIQYTSDRSSKIHDYFVHYEQFLEKYRHSRIKILEIGGRTSASAKVWTEYFSNAELHIIDTHPLPELSYLPRVVVHKISQFSNEIIEKLADDIAPTLAFDDGTHLWSHQMIGIHSVFPSIKPGGLLIIEDLQTSFGPYQNTHGDMKLSTANFLTQLASRMLAGPHAPKLSNTAERYLATAVSKMSIIRQAVILHKKTTPECLYIRDSLINSSQTTISSIKHNASYPRVDGVLLHASQRQIGAFEQIRGAGDAKIEPSTSGLLKDVVIHGSGLGVTSDGIVLSETLNNIENVDEYANFFKRDQGRKWLSTEDTSPEFIEQIPNRQHVLLKGAWDTNYGHWLYDVLPRLHLLKDLNLKEKPLLIISPRNDVMSKVVYETLKLAGFTRDDVVEHDSRSRKYQSLVILGRTSRHPILKAPAATKYLEDITSEIPAGSDKRIYLSRNAYNRRRISNEEELYPILESKGFRVVYPEKLEFEEQVSLLKGAEVVAGNMGAAFSNLAFSPTHVKVLALFTPAMLHDFFYDIVCHKSGKYVGVQGTSSDDVPGMGSDFTISGDQLIEGLAQLEI